MKREIMGRVLTEATIESLKDLFPWNTLISLSISGHGR
jgi:hypothetical protein